MISANNDPEIGELPAGDGSRRQRRVITLEDSKTAETTYEVVEGCNSTRDIFPVFHLGYRDDVGSAREPYILIHEKKITNIRELVLILEKPLRR